MRPHLVLGVLSLGLPLAAQAATYAVFTNLTPATSPPDRERALMAHDPVRGRTLLAGGIAPGGSTPQDTWEWNGANWQQVVPTTQLNWNRRIRLVWASQRSQILAVLGEAVNGGSPMQIHGWTGTNWVLVNGQGPLSRDDAFDVAWDSTRGALVMFGHPFGAETWEWNGSTWALRGTGGPVPRTEHRMVYDPVRQVVVLYGGISLTNSRLNDTWEWNGVYWLERFGIAAANVSLRGTLGYDTTRQRVVLHGGYDTNGNGTGAVWEYDGTGWQQRTAQGGPSEMTNHAMAYDVANQRFVLFGGNVSGAWQRTRTLSFLTGTVASSSLHGSGCVGPAGVPSLLPIASSRPVLGTSFQVRFGNLENSPLAFVFATIGFQDQTWNGLPLPYNLSSVGMPTCLLRIEPVTTTVLSNVAGHADWSIALPPGSGLDGQQFFLQGAVIAPGWNAAGAVLSDSRRGVAGIL
jgi:hypothetical protein